MTWFPRWSPDGRKVLGESGDGWITVNGARVTLGFGPPVWLDNERFLYSNDTGTWTGGLHRAHDRPLVELAAGGGLWAGRDPQRNMLVISDGREIPNAGQPAFNSFGELIWREGDHRIEPTISADAAAWGDGAGRILGGLHDGVDGDLTVAGPEYRPRLVDTPEGPWLLTMTHTELRLRPFGADRGFRITPGENQNLHADVVCVGRILQVIYQNSAGQTATWLRSIDDPKLPFAVPNPGTTVPNPGTPPMTEQEIVARVRAQYPTPLGLSHAACLIDIATALGNGAGLLRKDGGTHIVLPDGTNVSQDIVMYPDGRIFDVLGDAEGEARPTWQDKGTLDPARYYRVGSSTPPPPQPPEPPPSHELTLEQRVSRLEAWLRSFPR